MKTLFIIRHAKSDQSFLLNDFDRPLNERGKNDAPEMAKRLIAKNYEIDAFISSPAKRAKTTAVLFAKEFNVLSDEIVFIQELYHAPAAVFFDVITQLPNELNSVAIFSHNPGITYFVNELVDNVKIDNMPTCGVFAICFDERWDNFTNAKKKLLSFDWPKKQHD